MGKFGRGEFTRESKNESPSYLLRHRWSESIISSRKAADGRLNRSG